MEDPHAFVLHFILVVSNRYFFRLTSGHCSFHNYKTHFSSVIYVALYLALLLLFMPIFGKEAGVMFDMIDILMMLFLIREK